MLAHVQAQLAQERAARVAAEEALAVWQRRALGDKVAGIHTCLDAAQHVDDLTYELDEGQSRATTNGHSDSHADASNGGSSGASDDAVTSRLARTEAALRNIERVLRTTATAAPHIDGVALLDELRSCVYEHDLVVAAEDEQSAARASVSADEERATRTPLSPPSRPRRRALRAAAYVAGFVLGAAGGAALRLAVRRARHASP